MTRYFLQVWIYADCRLLGPASVHGSNKSCSLLCYQRRSMNELAARTVNRERIRTLPRRAHRVLRASLSSFRCISGISLRAMQAGGAQCVLTNRLASSAVKRPVISAPISPWKRRMASRINRPKTPSAPPL